MAKVKFIEIIKLKNYQQAADTLNQLSNSEQGIEVLKDKEITDAILTSKDVNLIKQWLTIICRNLLLKDIFKIYQNNFLNTFEVLLNAIEEYEIDHLVEAALYHLAESKDIKAVDDLLACIKNKNVTSQIKVNISKLISNDFFEVILKLLDKEVSDVIKVTIYENGFIKLAEKGSVEVIAKLLDNITDENERYKLLHSINDIERYREVLRDRPFQGAVENQHKAVIELFLQLTPDQNDKDKMVKKIICPSILFPLVESDNWEIIDILYNNLSIEKYKNSLLEVLAQLAAQKGKAEFITKLAEKNNSIVKTAFASAIYYGDLKIVKHCLEMLSEEGQEKLLQSIDNKQGLLKLVGRNGDKALLEKLLNNNFKAPDEIAHVVLGLIEGGYPYYAEELWRKWNIDQTLSIDIVKDIANAAIKKGYLNIARLCWPHIYNQIEQDKDNYNYDFDNIIIKLSFIAAKEGDEKLVKDLLSLSNECVLTPSRLSKKVVLGAVKGSKTDILTYILNSDENSSLYLKALYSAAKEGNVKVLNDLLLIKFSDEITNIITSEGFEVFRIAARYGNLSFLERLLNLLPKDSKEEKQAVEIALIEAAQDNQLNVVEGLLKKASETAVKKATRLGVFLLTHRREAKDVHCRESEDMLERVCELFVGDDDNLFPAFFDQIKSGHVEASPEYNRVAKEIIEGGKADKFKQIIHLRKKLRGEKGFDSLKIKEAFALYKFAYHFFATCKEPFAGMKVDKDHFPLQFLENLPAEIVDLILTKGASIKFLDINERKDVYNILKMHQPMQQDDPKSLVEGRLRFLSALYDKLPKKKEAIQQAEQLLPKEGEHNVPNIALHKWQTKLALGGGALGAAGMLATGSMLTIKGIEASSLVALCTLTITNPALLLAAALAVCVIIVALSAYAMKNIVDKDRANTKKSFKEQFIENISIEFTSGRAV